MENMVYHVHTIELGDSVMFILILALAAVAFYALYTAQASGPAFDSPKEPMGFRKR